ncbi:MAG: alkaline phosphatase family protein [Thermoanaerobaculia bacterium]
MSEALRRFHPLAVGAAAGAAWADLLLGLNPELLAPGRALALGGIVAAGGALLASPLLLLADRPHRRRGGGALLFALFASLFAAFAEAQRGIFYTFVAGDARRVLGATAVVAGLWALLSLVSAFASLGPARRAMGAAPLPLLFLGLFLVAPLLARRSASQASLATLPSLPAAARRSLLIVGLDGVSWELVTAGASEGFLPTLAELLKKGAAGPLASGTAVEPLALWTTAATGKRPFKHGAVSEEVWETPAGPIRLRTLLPGSSLRLGLPFTRPRPAPAGYRSLAFWEILARLGHETSVLGWPGAAAADADERLKLFRVGPSRLDRPLVRSLSPAGLSPELAAGTTLAAAARDLTILGAALGTPPQGPSNVLVLVLSGAALVSRPFGAAGDARYWGLPVPDAGPKAQALTAYYRFLDDLLRDLLEREGRDRTICIFSPVSYGPPPPLDELGAFLRANSPSASPDAGADGFLLLQGAGIRAGVRLTSAELLDLAPTLLVLAGEPMARDSDGRVLAEAFDERFTGSTSIPIVTTFEPGGPQ